MKWAVCPACESDLREVGYFKSTNIEERVPYSYYAGVFTEDDVETVNNGGGTTTVRCGNLHCQEALPDEVVAQLERLSLAY